MKSKIIKVSIILIFMMFSAGLFNFCFAWEIGTDIVETDMITLNISHASSSKGYIKFADFTKDLPNAPSVGDLPDTYGNNTPLSKSNKEELIKCYNTYPHVIFINNITYPDSVFYFFPRTSDSTILYNYDGKLSYLKFCSATNFSGNASAYFRFDYSEEKWYVNYAQEIPFSIYEDSTFYYIIENTAFSIYDYDKNLIYEPSQEPTNEELITNCDFKVNFKFAPKSEDFPIDDIGTRWSWPCRLLLQHSMTNWENYNVKVKLSVIDKTQPNGLYYDLYNSEGEEIKKKGHIKEAFLTEEINNGDFFLMFTDNLQDTFKLEYEIYNKSNELLMTKSYTFKFTKSGLTYYNSTGTIIEEQTQDANGNDISSEDNSFDTNGYDNTNNNNDNDYYDVSNLNNLVSSANDTISLTQKCFAILPGFIWAMVGIFLSVCIALRILGR